MQEDQRVLQFLMKLNDNFSTVRANILMMTPLINVTQAYRIVAQEENHKQISQQVSIEVLAFAADKRRFTDTRSQQSQNSRFQSPNMSRNGGFQQQQNTGFQKRIAKLGNSYYCTHCKMNGHSIERCFRIHGFPPGFKINKDRRVAAFSQAVNTESLPVAKAEDQSSKSVTTPSISADQYNQLIEMLTKKKFIDNHNETGSSRHALLAGKMCLLSKFSQEWFLDSGKTDHISP